jgi:hypothetical protein
MRGPNSSLSRKQQGGPPPAALVPVYDARRRRTIDLVKASIEALRADRLVVSLASIAGRSRSLDQSGRGVSETAILRNQEARALYQAHRSAAGRGPSASSGVGAWSVADSCDARDARPRTSASAVYAAAERRTRPNVPWRPSRPSHKSRVHRLRTTDELVTWMLITAQVRLTR